MVPKNRIQNHWWGQVEGTGDTKVKSSKLHASEIKKVPDAEVKIPAEMRDSGKGRWKNPIRELAEW